jgi:hypothetical protein
MERKGGEREGGKGNRHMREREFHSERNRQKKRFQRMFSTVSRNQVRKY